MMVNFWGKVLYWCITIIRIYLDAGDFSWEKYFIDALLIRIYLDAGDFSWEKYFTDALLIIIYQDANDWTLTRTGP